MDATQRQRLSPRALWRRLTEPVAAIQGAEQRRKARLLSALLASVFILDLVVVSLVLVVSRGGDTAWALRSILVLALAYGLSRTRYYTLAAATTAAIFPLAIFAMMLSRPSGYDVFILAYLGVGVLLSSLFLSIRWTVAVAAVDVLGMLLLPAVLGVSFGDLMAPLTFVLFISGITVIIAALRRQDLQQIERQYAELREAEGAQRRAETERMARVRLESTVGEYVAFVEAVGQGDLVRRLRLEEADGESAEALTVLGGHLNRMVGNLATLAQQVRLAGERVHSAAGEILAATTQQLAAATEQDATIHQTLVTVTEVQTLIADTAERAANVAERARRSVEVSQRGTAAVADSVEGMRRLHQQVGTIAENILALSEKTQQIGKIIATVNEIADQSRLLALNAAIEAARAGEEGRGFAVVAQEVRKMAEQSRAATEQVQAILGEIQQATNAAVLVTEEGTRDAENSMMMVEQAGESIRDLATLLQETAQEAEQNAASTRQQATAMAQLAAAMNTVRQTTSQAQASTQQAERSAQNLSVMAQQMQEVIAQYQLPGGEPVPAPPPA